MYICKYICLYSASWWFQPNSKMKKKSWPKWIITPGSGISKECFTPPRRMFVIFPTLTLKIKLNTADSRMNSPSKIVVDLKPT